MRRYYVLEICKDRILFLCGNGFTDNKSAAATYSETEAKKITSEYNHSYCDFSKCHYNYVEVDKTKNMRSNNHG